MTAIGPRLKWSILVDNSPLISTADTAFVPARLDSSKARTRSSGKS